MGQEDIGGLNRVINLDYQLCTTCRNRVAVVAYDDATWSDVG